MKTGLCSFTLFVCAFLLLVTMATFAPAAGKASKNIILATTTSTQDSGLLDLLVPLFEKKSGYRVKTIAVGSGQALKLGEKGEADVLLVHSPEAEKIFMFEGKGSSRRLVMYNDFVLAGPPADPAGVRSARNSSEAFHKIDEAGALFLSRGDNSGTHARERALWQAAGVIPEGRKWYQQTGLGMGQTLNVAAEKKGYILTDRATFLSMKKILGLEILLEGDSRLLNVYHVIQVNPAKWPRVNSAGAKAFADFMVAKKTQEIIDHFGTAKFGAPLFTPAADKRPEALGL
jgi:tungstate transport system substrate-binding protein